MKVDDGSLNLALSVFAVLIEPKAFSGFGLTSNGGVLVVVVVAGIAVVCFEAFFGFVVLDFLDVDPDAFITDSFDWIVCFCFLFVFDAAKFRSLIIMS